VNKEDGQMVWDYEKIYSIFAVQGTKVFVSSMADNSGHITVLEKTTGKKLSEIILPKESPVWDILADEKALYLRLGAEGLLMAVDQEKGKEIWSTAYGCRGIGCSAGKLTRSGKILCGTNRDASEIVAFNPEDGTVLWKKSLRDYLMPIMAGDSRQEGGVYTFSLDESGTVLKLNAQGEMVWKERAVLDCCPCSDHIKELEGTLYLGGARGLAALDGATGKVKWTRKYEEMTNYPHYFERYSTGDLSLNGPTLEVLLLGSAQKYARVVRLDANSGKLQR
jgi:outer membrane protein assembly factor BamB